MTAERLEDSVSKKVTLTASGKTWEQVVEQMGDWPITITKMVGAAALDVLAKKQTALDQEEHIKKLKVIRDSLLKERRSEQLSYRISVIALLIAIAALLTSIVATLTNH